MYIKICAILSVLASCAAVEENHDWELAVVMGNKIELLLPNGSLAGEPFGHFNEFTHLKAVTFDSIRHQFTVSDMSDGNDTIFTVRLTKETEVQTIIENLPDDIQGLAIDPITDVLYWTDSINGNINYLSLSNSNLEAKILFHFDDQSPHDITVDVCNRYIYWTNSHKDKPTIERAKIGSTYSETLINLDLNRPRGITVDYVTQRIIWADIKEGIYYIIESSNFEGEDRSVHYEGTHGKPFGVAVDRDAIYWTDSNRNALYSLPKNQKESVPTNIRYFDSQPLGLIVKNAQIKSLPQCEDLAKEIELIKENVTEEYEKESDAGDCLNGGYLREDSDLCHCPRGFIGDKCEISQCHNYCVHGECYTSSQGFPQCRCSKGFGGKRCERDVCDGFCLNKGRCTPQSHSGALPTCSCREGFTGSRCESFADMCDVFCRKLPNDYLMSSEQDVLCKCVDGFAESSAKLNFSSLPLLGQESRFTLDYFQDPVFLALIFLVIVLLVIVSIFAAYASKRRPRIKKRIIVNKNVTPLNYTPRTATEHCEITIENCCNMNICETPCFEPPNVPCLQTKNDDKKKLLSNMEHQEDFY